MFICWNNMIFLWILSVMLSDFVMRPLANSTVPLQPARFRNDQWSFQGRLITEDLGNINTTLGASHSRTFYNGESHFGLMGRGFLTLVSGYNEIDPGIYIHTNDDGFAAQGLYVWTQQSKLVPKETKSSDNFGKWLEFTNYTILASAPNYGEGNSNDMGAIYVFNGTLRHWTQLQKLISEKYEASEIFGEKFYLDSDQNQMIVGAEGYDENRGIAYIFNRPKGGCFWSRSAYLLPWEPTLLEVKNGVVLDTTYDGYPDQHFGRLVTIHKNTAIVASLIDSESKFTKDYSKAAGGSAYVFKNIAGLWSQQQKLVADDLFYNQPGRGTASDLYKHELPTMFFGSDVAVHDNVAAFGVARVNGTTRNEKSIFIYKGFDTTNKWSLQQKLFVGNDSTDEQIYGTKFQMKDNTLISTFFGPDNSVSYIFKTFGNGWSQVQRLIPTANMTNATGYGSVADGKFIPNANFSNPNIWGGNLFYTSKSGGNSREIQMLSRYSNRSCLLLWMSDHFGDGWDSAVLTVRAPDVSNDTFHPHCDQVDPFYVRYCPYSPEDEGVYLIQIFAAVKARFHWEISWQVMVEDTGIWYQGDFATKMKFKFSNETMKFSFYGLENPVDVSAMADCFSCMRIAQQSWAQLQLTGGNSFWPLDVTGAPYYISDYEGRAVYARGRVCGSKEFYQCYQTLTDGVYILRLGGGLFGKETGFPRANATWNGCDEIGGHRDQLIFQIAFGKCIPIQVYHYSGRCDKPSSYELAKSFGTVLGINSKPPTAGGTVMPSVNVFGPEYERFKMYSVGNKDKREDSMLTTSSQANDKHHKHHQTESDKETKRDAKVIGDLGEDALFFP